MQNTHLSKEKDKHKVVLHFTQNLTNVKIMMFWKLKRHVPHLLIFCSTFYYMNLIC